MGRLRLWMQHPVFAHTNEETCRVLYEKYVVRKYPAGEKLIIEGDEADHVYILFKGLVQFHNKTSDGMKILVKIQGAPSVLGVVELFTKKKFMRTISAITEVYVAILPFETYLKLVKKFPIILYYQMKLLANESYELSRFERNICADVEDKMLYVLLEYANFFGSIQDNNLVIKYPLSQKDLSSLAGVSERAGAIVFSKWRNENNIIRQNGNFVIQQFNTVNGIKVDESLLAQISKNNQKSLAPDNSYAAE